jgi:hypothetical protein
MVFLTDPIADALNKFTVCWHDKDPALISDFELKRKAHHWCTYM